jgi:hypothetical protein
MTALRNKKTTVFAKAESVYGTAVALVAADAIRTHGAKITPFSANAISRDLDGQAFGNSGDIHTGAHVMLEFDVEAAGSGVAGTAPNYGKLFKACQMSETIVAVTSVTYAPASSGTTSLTMYFQLDGQRHALVGARGSWQIKFDSQSIAYFHFVFTGLWVDPASIADIVPDFTGFTVPRPVSYAYTPTVTLHALASIFKSFSYDHGNDVEFFDNPGEQTVEIMDRKPVGKVSLLAPTLTTKNYFTTAKADTTGGLTLVHGMTAGNIWTLAAGYTQLKTPAYGDDKGRATLDADLNFLYSGAAGGSGVDDEMSLAFT